MDIGNELKKILPENRVKLRYIDLVSFASDAGFYHLVPKAIVQPVGEAEIVSLFHFSQAYRIPLVFRTGGTSLSGQAITDGILVDLSQFWDKIQIEEDGLRVRFQSGITGARVNAVLKKYGRKIGPDPSSISAAMMGGILSNNASGMCCGVTSNSYHTLKHIRFILPNGKIFSTEMPGDYDRFKNECFDLYHCIISVRAQIISNRVMYNQIRAKYQTKNTVGYSLNSFIDFEHPLDIMAHLLIGAEGTLAFISEAVLQTVPEYRLKATSLLYFPDIFAACRAIQPLITAGAVMVELMDRASLRAVENMEGMPAMARSLPESAAALLIEFQENDQKELRNKIRLFLNASASLSLFTPPVFTTDAFEQELLWKIRKGLFPAVGAIRASGTTVILEDIAVPVKSLGNAILSLQKLFVKFGYTNAIIFGHAKDGNLHFVITQSFESATEINRYDLFMQDVVSLVVNQYKGALKAEHGTGRNMSPFVETEWGAEVYLIMKRIKQTVDAESLLNPGVIINDDKNAHIKNLKLMPSVEEEVDKCIECGYCEHVCPSRNLTTTPRRRIVIRRTLKKLQDDKDRINYQRLLKEYNYDGLATCAVDGLCSAACPVDINTGDLVKRLRMENHSTLENKIALAVARNFSGTVQLIRTILTVGISINKIFGNKAMYFLTKGLKALIPVLPLWPEKVSSPPDLKCLNKDIIRTKSEREPIVYFPSCISRVMGSYQDERKNIMEAFLSVCQKSGIDVVVPDNIKSSCCSQIYASKGFAMAHKFAANHIIESLWFASDKGSYAVVTDVSSCAFTLTTLRPVLSEENKSKFDLLRIMDSVDFLHDMVMPGANVRSRKGTIILHPVCSLQKMKTLSKFLATAKYFAVEVAVPQQYGCCGMAGDRGFLYPELTDSATHNEAKEVNNQQYDGYYSTTKTCEIAMSKAVGANYKSIIYLVDQAL